MNTKQVNRFNMYLAVKAYLSTKLSVLSALPNFAAIFSALQAFITAIEGAIEQQSFDKTGVTKSKKELKQALALIAGDISRKLYAYALLVTDHVLLTEMKVSQSKLKSKSDEPLKETAEGIYNRAALLLEDLASYGITTATQLELRGAIDNFATSMTKPRLSDAAAKETTRKLKEDFKGAEKKLKEIKAVMEIIRLSDPATYNAFKQASKVIPYGMQSYAVRGVITDANTKEGIKGVTIAFLNGDGTDLPPVMIKKTAAKGGFNVKSLAEGIYQVKLIKNGYREVVIPGTINPGELCRINVEMSEI